MALPVGVTTATITFGVPVTFTGNFVRSTVSVVPSASLVHTATGTPLVNFIEDVITTEGTSGQFALPHTDQTGFQDEAGNSYQNWYYTATITYASDKGTLPARTKTFQLTSGQTVVDLDLLPAGAPVLPYTAQTATVTSFAGRTGAVTVQDSDLPERLSDTVLSATYAKSIDPAARGLRSILDMGITTAVGWLGDSTGDADSGGSGDRFAVKLAQKIAARYPAYHVLSKQWNNTTQDYNAWAVLQTAAAGRRYVQFSNAPTEHLPSTNPDFTTGVMDVRVLALPDTWVPGGGSYRCLVNRLYDASTASKPQFSFNLKADGYLNVSYSTNGTNTNQGFNSTAVVPGAAGVPLWLRVTVEIIVGTSINVKFYTSPATDGVTWTQLGTSVSFADAGVQALYPQPTAKFQLGAKGYVQDPYAGKIYEVQVRDGLNGPCIAPACPTLYSTYPNGAGTASQGGAPTLYLINGSKSGADVIHLADATRLPKMTPNYGQRVQFFNTAHNDGNASPYAWTKPYEDWVNAVKARLSLAAPVAVGQSPHDPARWANEATQGDTYRLRIVNLAALAATNRWGYLDMYNQFLEDPRGLAVLISSDGLHPSPTGYEFGGQLADKMLGPT